MLILPTIDKPTRVHTNSASLIDNIFVNNPELISSNLVTDVSNNFPQTCLVTTTKDEIKRKQSKTRDLSHFNPDSLNSGLATNLQSGVFLRADEARTERHEGIIGRGHDLRLPCYDRLGVASTHANTINELFTTFYKTLNKIINKHAPINTLSQRRIKQFSKPWIIKGIRIKEKKTDSIKLGIRTRINTIEIKFAVVYV